MRQRQLRCLIKVIRGLESKWGIKTISDEEPAFRTLPYSSVLTR